LAKNSKAWGSMERKTDTITIQIKTFGMLNDFVKDRSIELEKGSSLLNLFCRISEKYGDKVKDILIDRELNQVSSSICILINGAMADNLETKLKEYDQVTFFIAVSGG
jgi:molybdopterin converting factor small subunit